MLRSYSNFREWKGAGGKLFKGESFDVFGVHPAQFGVVEHCRRFVQTGDVEAFRQFSKSENFPVAFRRPAQQSDVVDDRIREITFGDQIFKTYRTVTFGEFGNISFGITPHYQRQMHISRDLPAECLIEQIVFGGT